MEVDSVGEMTFELLLTSCKDLTVTAINVATRLKCKTLIILVILHLSLYAQLSALL